MSSNRNILVCVTQQKTCERLIRKAAEINKNGRGYLYVIHVAKDDTHFLNNDSEGEALEYLFNISKKAGADLHVLKSDNIVKTIAQFAVKNRINMIIIGESPECTKNQIYLRLKNMLKNVNITIISHNDG